MEPPENREGGRWFRLSALNTPSVISVVNMSWGWLLCETLQWKIAGLERTIADF